MKLKPSEICYTLHIDINHFVSNINRYFVPNRRSFIEEIKYAAYYLQGKKMKEWNDRC